MIMEGADYYEVTLFQLVLSLLDHVGRVTVCNIQKLAYKEVKVMKKLNLAIIGQGRSGKNIHGRFYRTDDNQYFNVKYVVEADDFRRERAKNDYPGCVTFADYHDLYALDDIDLVVNDTFTEQIDAIKNFEETIRKRKAEIKSGIDMLDEIISEGAISNTHLRMLIKEILIAEVDGKLRIKIQMKAKFISHIDFIPDADDPMYQSMGPCLLER